MLISESDCQIGMPVKIGGKEGVIIERYADEVKVRFNDGESGFYSINEIECVLYDTRMKSYSGKEVLMASECPFCRNEGVPVGMDDEHKQEKAFQCTKCNQRYSKDDPQIKRYKGKVYCNHCGKLTAKSLGNGLYKCESCTNQFNLN